MNKPIKPIQGYVETKYLYDGESKNGVEKYTACCIVAISSYLAQALTFHVLIDSSFLYSDVPITALKWHLIEESSKYSLQDLSYIKCKSLDIDIFELGLAKNDVSVYFPRLDTWEKGIYCLSCDFYSGNDLVHLTKLASGGFAWVPNHKINFVASEYLPDYKKCHTEWTW